RGFIIVGITLYLIIMRKKFTLELILLVTSLTIIGINTVIGLLLKDPYHILAELKVSLKVIYYLVMLLITLSVIRSWKSIKIKETIYRAITTVSIIISVSFWIAYLSKTTFSSYSYDKSGISGWYFSANELSAIIVILIGFTIAKVHEKR